MCKTDDAASMLFWGYIFKVAFSASTLQYWTPVKLPIMGHWFENLFYLGELKVLWGFPVCIRKIIYSYLTHLDKSVVTGLTFSQAVIFVLLLFHSGSDSKECACKAGDQGLILGLERYPRERNGYPPQYSCLGNHMTEEPGGLQSMGLQRVGHYWMNNTWLCQWWFLHPLYSSALHLYSLQS